MSYNIPRNVKGEGRILYIFSYKALIYTGIGVGIGVIFYYILSLMMLEVVGYVVIGILGLIGFGIGTLKLPDISILKSARLAAGDEIDDVIKRAIKFKLNKNKYYIYKENDEGENTQEEGGKTNGK